MFLLALDLCCHTQVDSQALGIRASVAAAHGLSRWVLQALECEMAHGLSFSVACGTFPDQGSNLCPLH